MTPNNKIKPARALLLAAALLLPAAASALTSDRNQPIQIEADQGSLDQGNRSTEFSGNVVIQQGTMYIRAAKARVLFTITRRLPGNQGYVLEIGDPWPDFPSNDVEADTQRMNQMIEAQIRTMPEQYYWVHRRFKTRPEGEASLY